MQLERNDIDSKIENKLLVQLTNDDPKAYLADEDRITKIIELANSMIDDALRGQYTLPLVAKHRVLTEIGIEISIYNFYLIRNRSKMPEDVRTNYQSALKMLDDYSKGYKKLDIPTGEITPVSIKKNYRQQKFTQDILSRY